MPASAPCIAAATDGRYSLTGLFLFILALQLLKSGAGGLKPILNAVSADGVVNLFGFGWIGSYGVMSGSPVAAISLSLFSAGTISDVESFAMINGSRLGASFIVLFVGFLQYVMHRRTADGLFIGVVALLVAFTLWLPVLPLGIIALESGWFDGISVGTPGELTSFIDVVYDPIVERADDLLPANRDLRARHRCPADRLHDLRPRAAEPRTAQPARRADQGVAPPPVGDVRARPRDHGDDALRLDLADAPHSRSR